MSEIINTLVKALLELFAQGIKTLPGLLSALVILFLTKYAVKVIEKIADETGKRAIKSQSLRLLLLKISKISTWTLGILFACALGFPSFHLRDIIASLGIGSIAIGFAFQDIFKNFLAGIILLVEEPFQIGDEIVIDGYRFYGALLDYSPTKTTT